MKTGITQNAGPCLATCVTIDGQDLIVILLACKSMDHRWGETWKLANWTASRLKKIKKFQAEQDAHSPQTDQIQHVRLLNRIKHL